MELLYRFPIRMKTTILSRTKQLLLVRLSLKANGDDSGSLEQMDQPV